MNAKPRILFATTVAATLRAFLLPFAQRLREDGWRVDAMAEGIETDCVCRSSFDKVWEANWSRNPLHPRNLSMPQRIRDLTVENLYDIVHVHTPVAGFMTRLGLRSLVQERRPQVIYTAHGFHFHSLGGSVRNMLFETLERRAAKWTDFLVVINKEDLRAAVSKRLIRPDGLRFMPGIGVDRSRYSRYSVSPRETERLLNELQLPVTTPLLLMVAEFTERKRHRDAIRAFAQLRRSDAHLLLAGSGPLFNSMKQLAKELCPDERIHFMGDRNDIPRLMKASSAVILPSVQEGLPRCILEAMSMGVPVIGTRIRGTKELLERNAGVLVDVGNIPQLTEAMQLILDNQDVATTMGNAGVDQSEPYDLSHILHMHEQLYEEALERRYPEHVSHRHQGVAFT